MQTRKFALLVLLISQSYSVFAQSDPESGLVLPWKNAVKIEVGGLIPYFATRKIYGLGLDYERSFNKTLSLCLYVGIERPVYMESSNSSTTVSAYYQGFTVSPRVRFYLNNKQPSHPRGTYVQLGGSYSKIHLHSPNNMTLYAMGGIPLKTDTYRAFALLGVGHQGFVGKHITLSGAINLNIKADGNDFSHLPGNTSYVLKGSDLSFSVDLGIGYAFGVR